MPSPETTRRITASFEQFNRYAALALQGGDDADVYALLAVAFELSQMRYQMTHRLDNHENTRQSPAHR